MEELTAAQMEELKLKLQQLRDELKALRESTKAGTRPISLDEPIGRLTRMEAIQQQSMSTASRGQADLKLKQVEQALSLMERGDYGLCRRCEEPIGYPRLNARPESPYCLPCQDKIDRKHG